MKWNMGKTTSQFLNAHPGTLGGVIAERIKLYERLGWISDVASEDIIKLVNDAKAAEQRIASTGLNTKPHGVYRIGIIPACFPALHPHSTQTVLRDLLGEQRHDDWGYVNPGYYGERSDPKDIPHGFTDADIGKVFFLVEDENAPGRNPKMPGSLLTDMYWGEERDAAWAEWKGKYAAAGAVKALNYASHSLIWLGETASWGGALGRIGVYDYIEQPYDARRDICPCGYVNRNGARRCALGADAAPDSAAAAVVW